MVEGRGRGRATDGNISTNRGVGASVRDKGGDGRMGVKREVKGAGVRVRWEAEFGFDIHGGVVGEETCGGENWYESTGESIANEVVRTDFADVFALENVITEGVDSVAAGAARGGGGWGEKR